MARIFAQFFVRRSFLSIVSGFIDSLAFLMLLGCGFVFYFAYVGWHWVSSHLVFDLVANPTPSTGLMTNTHALAQLIYTDYVFAFQSAGVILLVAMIGAISLCLRKREGVKKQNPFDQMNRQVSETLELKKVPVGQGVQL
jgi:NADH-quinone oxidoreductase subunit J